jgi:hypothetical protein
MQLGSWIGSNVRVGLAGVMNVTYGGQVETGYMGPGWKRGMGWRGRLVFEVIGVVGHRHSTFSTNHNIARV